MKLFTSLLVLLALVTLVFAAEEGKAEGGTPVAEGGAPAAEGGAPKAEGGAPAGEGGPKAEGGAEAPAQIDLT
ncbi:UNVERIFIED_CONTAM: hypothetical protein HDU68_012373, partial [Siphonaria sp. JEL0065]